MFLESSSSLVIHWDKLYLSYLGLCHKTFLKLAAQGALSNMLKINQELDMSGFR